MVRIVIVEDDRPALRLLAWGLKEEGFAVESCGPSEVAACVTAIDPAPDIALINILCQLPEKRACIQSVHDAGVNCVVDLCGDPGEDCGADAVVGSPFKLASIIDVMKQLLANG